MEIDEGIKTHIYGKKDEEGRVAKLCIWNYPGNDVAGVVARYDSNMIYVHICIIQRQILDTNMLSIFCQ